MKIKKLGLSYHGFCEEYKDSLYAMSPDGGRFTRPILTKELHRRDIDIICLQKQRESKALSFLKFDETFPDIDALFIEWRWPTYKNDKSHPNFNKDKYESDFDRQDALLDYYYGKIPIIIWDTDLTMTDQDIDNYKDKAILAEPCLFPNDNFESLPYFSDFQIKYFNESPKSTYIYIGNNYDRYWAVDKYYFSIANDLFRKHGVQTQFFGNWLEQSPERPEQIEYVERYKERINFFNRCNFRDSMMFLSNSLCTTHIVKKLYCERGLITPRFFESLAAGLVSFVMEDFSITNLLGDYYIASKDLVDKIVYLKLFDNKLRLQMVNGQMEHVKNNFPELTVEHAVDKMLKLFNT